MDQELVRLGATLVEVMSRNTISFVGGKMAVAKEKQDKESQSLAYTEIINNLLQDKEDITMIAREYKQAYDHVTISDEDIQYLHNTLKSAISVLGMFSKNSEDSGDNEKNLNNLVELLNKDTLKTMQLLGFNYKEAIGQPLTEVCAEAIKTKLKTQTNSSNNNRRK